MQLTVSKAARLYGKARSTIHRAIEAGRLSCGFSGDGTRVIDLSELIRIWGEPPKKLPEMQQRDVFEMAEAQQAVAQELAAMRKELMALREEVAQLRALPAPTPPPKEVEKEANGDDPHGFSAMIKAIRESEKGKGS
jgi:polyhydroxyalkanoate synthesis regulator phasin